MKKWKIEALMVLAAVLIGCGLWSFAATESQRKANAEYRRLVKFSKRQAVEIIVIEQAAKLSAYKKQMAAAKKPFVQLPVQPVEE